MGYRVALALNREYQLDPQQTKDILAQVGQTTCAQDAIQYMCGCTSGKRNLEFTDSGKATYILRSMSTGKAVRVYVHYWDDFDQVRIRKLKNRAKAEGASEADRIALKQHLDQVITHILEAPEQNLFRIQHLKLPVLEKAGGFNTQACEVCGEFVVAAKLIEHGSRLVCLECSG